MTDAQPIRLSPGLPETVIPPAAADAQAALAAATGPDATGPDAPGPHSAGPDTTGAIAAVCARWPRYLDAWAALGEVAAARGEHVAAYASFRVGYHRGLDQLRAAGWRGSGYCRWTHESNRGFLRSLDGLRRMAEVIGEDDEAQRCQEFLMQLDPAWTRRADR